MSANSLSIAHYSDAHLPLHGRLRAGELIGKRGLSALNWWRKRRHAHDPAVAEALVADIAAHGPDHVAMTGDVVNFGLAREFSAGAAWLSRQMAAEALSFVPGNHEAIMPGQSAARDAAFAPFITGDDGVAGYPYLRRRGPVALIGLSSSIATLPLLAKGAVGAAQIDALRDMLRQARDLCRIVLVHHPPTGVSKPRRALRDRAALSAAIADEGSELVLHGHNHRAQLSWIAGAQGNIPVLGVPSASILPGLREVAAEWRLIRVTAGDEQFAISVRRRQAQTGSGFANVGDFRLTAPRPFG